MTLRQLYLSGTPADGTAATSANTGAANFLVPAGSTATWRTAYGAHGNRGVALVAGVTSTSALRTTFTASNTQVAFTGVLSMPTAQTTNVYTVAHVQNVGGTAVMRLQFRVNGDFGLYDSTSTARATFANGTLTWGSQYVVQVNVSTAGAYRIAVSTLGGSLVGDYSGTGASFGSTAYDRMDLFPGGSLGNHGWTEVQLDDGNTGLIPAYSASVAYSGSIALSASGSQSRTGAPKFQAGLNLSGQVTGVDAGSPATYATYNTSGAGVLSLISTPALEGSISRTSTGSTTYAATPSFADSLDRTGVSSLDFAGSVALNGAIRFNSEGALSAVGTFLPALHLKPRRVSLGAPSSETAVHYTSRSTITERVPA